MNTSTRYFLPAMAGTIPAILLLGFTDVGANFPAWIAYPLGVLAGWLARNFA